MDCMERINFFVNNDPMALVLMGFMSGLLFSSTAWGIVYVIIFLIIWEILYFGYLDVNNCHWDFQLRLTVILAAILGYLTGRFFHFTDDHLNHCKDFKKDLNQYGKDFGWFN